jgi:hypothetical protein
LSTICLEIQDKLTELKRSYTQKKKTLSGKIDRNQSSIESLFTVYYDTLNALRGELLSEEYKLRSQMQTFEREMRQMTQRLK